MNKEAAIVRLKSRLDDDISSVERKLIIGLLGLLESK